jgi:hypothetical protein
VASALAKNDPFLLVKSDPHLEHDLPQGKAGLSLWTLDIIHAAGVPFASQTSLLAQGLTVPLSANQAGKAALAANRYLPVARRQIAPSWCSGGSVLGSIPGSFPASAEERYPIRQVLAALTGLPSIAITSQDAYRVLERFGLTVDTEE